MTSNIKERVLRIEYDDGSFDAVICSQICSIRPTTVTGEGGVDAKPVSEDAVPLTSIFTEDGLEIVVRLPVETVFAAYRTAMGGKQGLKVVSLAAGSPLPRALATVDRWEAGLEDEFDDTDTSQMQVAFWRVGEPCKHDPTLRYVDAYVYEREAPEDADAGAEGSNKIAAAAGGSSGLNKSRAKEGIIGVTIKAALTLGYVLIVPQFKAKRVADSLNAALGLKDPGESVPTPKMSRHRFERAN